MALDRQRPKTEDQRPIDWKSVRRVLVVRLRSIGDTVLSTPSLTALRRFLPDAEIDILLEDWVAPLLDGFEGVNVVSIGSGNAARLKAANFLRRRKYDVAFNLHGGTTASTLTRATGATHRIGFSHYRYPRVYTHLYGSSTDFWHREDQHSAEQQLALLGLAGVPVDENIPSTLTVTAAASESLSHRLEDDRSNEPYAVLHPAAAFEAKQWPTRNFARVAEFLAERGIRSIAVASKGESDILEDLKQAASVPVTTFDDLTLPEITALASKAAIFVGNDSGIAHIAAAVETPLVVIFGPSNRTHWRPWTSTANEVVHEADINEVSVEPVEDAIASVLAASEK